MKQAILIFVILNSLNSCKNKGKNDPSACNGNTRRLVKLCTDPSRFEIDTNALEKDLTWFETIEIFDVKSKTERLDFEKQTYSVTALVEKVSRQRDGDYHIRLKSGEDNYLVCESANPKCSYAATSRFRTEFLEVYNHIENTQLEGKIVTITGVAFVDIDHGYKYKRYKNNVELHPILKIK